MTEDLTPADLAATAEADIDTVDAKPRARTDLRAPPFPLGRFTVLSELGRGAMGVVYTAYDDALDRKVAVKLVKSVTADRTARLRTEARAMARLAHPNVVVVHEVGDVDGLLFVAMEYVQGATLRAWLRQRERSHAEILDTFVQAGRGLAAAHAAGIVHRDFKPDNVMVDEAGRVRVMDFGLARAHDLGAEEVTQRDDQSGDDKLTRTGSIVGTPAYMAPEQIRGELADERSDQFSFCVALFEALHGRRPFVGDSWAALAHAVTRGEIATPSGSSLPGWLDRAVRRGLSVDPYARFESMDALVHRLVSGPGARRKAWLLVGSIAIATGLGALALQAQDDEVECTGGAAEIAGVWNVEQRELVAAAFARVTNDDTWRRASDRIDAYVDAWQTMHRDACEAANIRHEQSAQSLDLRMACLDRAERRLDVLLDVLADPDETVVENAVSAVDALPSIARCGDLDALMADVPPPEDPAAAAQVEAIERELQPALALRDTGRFGDALRIVDAQVEAAAAVGHLPLVARVALVHGELDDRLGHYASSQRSAEDALAAAVAGRADAFASEAITRLVWSSASRIIDLPQARRWARQSDAFLERAGRPDELVAAHHRSLGTLADAEGDYAGALEHAREAFAAEQRARGPDSPRLVLLRTKVGNAFYGLGRPAEARAEYQTALELAEATLGPAHPTTALVRTNFGLMLDALGDRDGAQAVLHEALRAMEAAHGPKHPDVAAVLGALGGLAHDRGDEAAALAYFERAIAIQEASEGTGATGLVELLNNVGLVHRTVGDFDAANVAYERAIAIVDRELGPDHPFAASPLGNLALVRMAQDRLDDAQALLERQLALLEKTEKGAAITTPLVNLAEIAERRGQHERAAELCRRVEAIETDLVPADHPDRSLPAACLARAYWGLEQLTDAVAWGRVELERCLGSDSPPHVVAEARFRLARILWDAGDHAEARTQASQAAEGYRAATAPHDAEAEPVDAWLAAHRD